MKRLAVLTVLLLCIFTFASYAQLFPQVDRPTSDDLSLLVLQFGKEKDDGNFEIVLNNNATGWAPAVKGPDGEIIPFRKYDSAADITNIYYSENLQAGEYTLVGFYHVYVDYGKLEEYKKEINNPNYLMSYEPFANRPFHVKQLFELSEHVTVNLEAGTVKSLGNYAVKFEWVEGPMGTTDTRWKANEEKTEFVLVKPFDDHVQRYIKTWRTRSWRPWNERNSVKPL